MASNEVCIMRVHSCTANVVYDTVYNATIHSVKLLSLVFEMARNSTSFMLQLVQLKAMELISYLLEKVRVGLSSRDSTMLGVHSYVWVNAYSRFVSNKIEVERGLLAAKSCIDLVVYNFIELGL